MSANAPPQNPTSHNVALLVPKFKDQDPDLRFMSLNDLHQILLAGHATFLQHDYTTCARVVEGFLATLNDQNGDVQNMAIKCLGPFVNRAPETILCPMIEKISNLRTDNTIDNSVPALAVRAIVVALPQPVQGVQRSPKTQEAYSAISRAVIPRLVGYNVLPLKGVPSPPKGMLQVEIESGRDTNSLDILIEVAKGFGPMLQEAEIKALQKITIQVLETPRCSGAMKKKAVTALAILSTYYSDEILGSFITYTSTYLQRPDVSNVQKKLFLSIYSALAKSIPAKLGPHILTIVPLILNTLSQEEVDRQIELEVDGDHDPLIEEVRECALVALDSLCALCAKDVQQLVSSIVQTALRFLKHDPNVSDEDEDMEDEESSDMEIEEDFEEETGFDDEDDISWKVRRSAAKLLHTYVNGPTLAKDDVIFGEVAPALIARFGEREESVRLEVLSTLIALITRAQDVPGAQNAEHDILSSKPTASRKRRRGSSSADPAGAKFHASALNGYTSPSTPPPQTSALNNLASISPAIVRAAAKPLKSGSILTKQACISLLTSLVMTRKGGLSQDIGTIMTSLLENFNLATGSAGSVSGAQNALHIEVLRLLRAVANYHSSKLLQPYLDQIMALLVSAARDKYGQVAMEAIETISTYIKALTPPRSMGDKGQSAKYLKFMFDTLVSRISAQETDTEVRQKSVVALGLLLGRTSGNTGSSLLAAKDRSAGRDIIHERLKNELTRLAAVHAVGAYTTLVQNPDELQPQWVQSISVEMSAQLRKANRALRGSSLVTLRTLALNPVCRQKYDDKTISELLTALLPLLEDSDLHMLGPALSTIAAYAQDKPRLVLIPSVITAICKATKLDLQGSTLDSLLEVVELFGSSGQGRQLMQMLLQDVGVSGDPEVVGQVIGTLLVAAGQQKLGVTIDDFKKELKTSADEKRKCLALYILGEAGLRLGSSSPLKPADFSQYFDTDTDKVQVAAAIALGRAGAGNVSKFLPPLLSANTKAGRLPLYAIREMLQHSAAEAEVLQSAKQLWDMILDTSKGEDNKALGAECLGRLAIIDPTTYLPQLQMYLNDKDVAVRGMVISAFRFTFADTDSAFDQYLQPIIVRSLVVMLNDSNLDNRRLGLTTFNSATHNKPQLVTSHLAELLPLAMKETVIRQDLIREVSMGPFKHKVDDGLELRKSAYETLYTLMESAFASLPLMEFSERILAGIADEHEIKIISCLMLTKLINLAPVETSRSLDKLAEAFRGVLAFKPKDNAVKQELEKLQEHNKAILKVMLLMSKAFPTEASESRVWSDTFEWAKKEHPQATRLAEEEVKEKDR